MTNLDGPRRAHTGELDAIIVLANEVTRAEQGRPPTIATDYSFIYTPENAQNIIVVMDGDRAVSMAGMWMNTVEAGAARLRAGGINCLATQADYRGQGLATKVMDAAVAAMAEDGCHVGRLATEIIDWYYRLGWENAGSMCIYELNHSNVVLLPELPEGFNFTDGNTFDDATVASIVRLHQEDRLGGVRTPSSMGDLLEADSDAERMGQRRHVVAWRNGQAVAYLLDSRFGIVEWGGPEELVAGLVRAWFVRRLGQRGGNQPVGTRERVPDSQIMPLVAPTQGHAFLGRLNLMSVPCQTGYWGMLHIIDPRGILDAFGLQEIGVAETNGQFRLTRGDESVTVTRQELAKLLFGPERISDFCQDVLPLLFWEWPVEHV